MAAMKARETEWAIERERLMMQANSSVNNVANNRGDARDIKAYLPIMCENDVLSFFLFYEKVMSINEVDKKVWARYLQPQITRRPSKYILVSVV